MCFYQDKAYGDNPPGDSIPKNAVLIFDIELLKIEGKDVDEANQIIGKIESFIYIYFRLKSN